MKILVHYTTRQAIYDYFKFRECMIENNNYIERFIEIDKYYKKWSNCQNEMIFVIQYYNMSNTKTKFLAGKIKKIDENTYKFILLRKEIIGLIIQKLGLINSGTYIHDIYYREYFIDSNEDFYNKPINGFSNKIRLKYYSWTELLHDDEILHHKLIDILFDKNNVLNLVTTINPKRELGKNRERILNGRYVSALKNVGFISEKEIDIHDTVLHGDIGEFLMDIMISRFIESNGNDTYIFPKLAYKTTPKAAVHGNDGTLYNITKKEIYYSESKFYEELSLGLSRAVDSLLKHDNSDYDFINANIEAFRNITDNSIGEVIEITEDVKEKVIIFLMCDDNYRADDVLETINRSQKLKKLKKLHEIIIFVLPVLNKENFLNLFERVSEQKGKELIHAK